MRREGKGDVRLRFDRWSRSSVCPYRGIVATKKLDQDHPRVFTLWYSFSARCVPDGSRVVVLVVEEKFRVPWLTLGGREDAAKKRKGVS